MSRRRRFKVESLAEAWPGQVLALPDTESRHARVLRLGVGDEVEVFDGAGRAWRAVFEGLGTSVRLEAEADSGPATRCRRLLLAVAWPKGKRAAVLVEKCTELGVGEILPMRCARSVVSVREGSRGYSRFQRIAAEAAKQCGRREVPPVRGERSFDAILAEAPGRRVFLLEPGAPRPLAEALEGADTEELMMMIGPEGGFTEDERAAARAAGASPARLADFTLRVETAAIAACAVAACARRPGAPPEASLP